MQHRAYNILLLPFHNKSSIFSYKGKYFVNGIVIKDNPRVDLTDKFDITTSQDIHKYYFEYVVLNMYLLLVEAFHFEKITHALHQRASEQISHGIQSSFESGLHKTKSVVFIQISSYFRRLLMSHI